jgi:hypothetical protein
MEWRQWRVQRLQRLRGGYRLHGCASPIVDQHVGCIADFGIHLRQAVLQLRQIARVVIARGSGSHVGAFSMVADSYSLNPCSGRPGKLPLNSRRSLAGRVLAISKDEQDMSLVGADLTSTLLDRLQSGANRRREGCAPCHFESINCLKECRPVVATWRHERPGVERNESETMTGRHGRDPLPEGGFCLRDLAAFHRSRVVEDDANDGSTLFESLCFQSIGKVG